MRQDQETRRLSMPRRFAASLGLCALLAPVAMAQITGDKIDSYFGDWHNATPRTVRGSLEERESSPGAMPRTRPKRAPFSAT